MKKLMCLSLILAVLACTGLAAWAQGPRSTNNINTLPNDTSTGTIQYYLSKVVTPGKLIRAATTDTAIELYPCVLNCGTSGDAKFITAGGASCFFDSVIASGAAGYFVVASTTTAGKCHAQVAAPTTGMVIGKLIADTTVNTTAAGDQRLILVNPVNYTPGTGGASSVSSGLANRLAYYPSDGTTVDDLPAARTANFALIGDGTSWITSAVAMGGAGACSASTVVTTVGANAAPTCSAVTSARVDTTVATTGGNLVAGTPSTVGSATGAFSWLGKVTPTALTGDVQNYTGCDGTRICRLDPNGADRIIGGLATGTDGREVRLCNIAADKRLILYDQHASSSAANRFLFGGTAVSIYPNACFDVWYDSVSTKWRASNSALLDSYIIKTCDIQFGSMDTSAPPIADTDDVVNTCLNNTLKDWRILAVSVWTNAGSPVFAPILRGGSATSILSGSGTCTGVPNVLTNCPVNGTPLVHSLRLTDGATCDLTPCSLDGSVTTGSTMTYGYIHLVGILQ